MSLSVIKTISTISGSTSFYCKIMQKHQTGKQNTFRFPTTIFCKKRVYLFPKKIIDRNKIQIEGTVEEIMPLGNLVGRYKSFNWKVFEIDGHNLTEIIETINTGLDKGFNHIGVDGKIFLRSFVYSFGLGFGFASGVRGCRGNSRLGNYFF